MKLSDTPITQHQFANIDFYLKRDDQLHPQFSGNKARKFMALLEQDYPQIDTLIGYGSAQANSLYSMAALAEIKGWQLEFYVDRIPTWLSDCPIGNYRGALALGAHVIPTAQSDLHPNDYIAQIRQPDERCLVVPEGGRCSLAEYGVQQLALEILDWTQQQANKQWVVALPSGTGTTALFLHKTLAKHGIEVLTCACVGGKDYLTEQFHQLGETSHPTILELESKHHFGKLYPRDYEVWQQLQAETEVTFDLLYDPMMWQCLLNWSPHHSDKTLIYIHQGGLLGNESMLPRYKRKYGESNDRQLNDR
ncbi:pyridoxal-phosphate dependent enzyme [Vibrio renipiscarius]|uniref:1-aminocyclopropane-1-carboxylate deaminase n=1 Tax=Vibrio renipiscarius TaxID=1461322 RepID=A0A0C2NR79_9VIBR|nr:pyridoxal-phosphate dependent enzyme [Vibrio renipiscarius]KII75529.1 1-aminocyclopropane-1-carboxylate deaminase [Vibrio renipiscarius]KII82021.1 1-aminocyclopropane-1-carboxylate deaminase [Vibrio renipiscarius]